MDADQESPALQNEPDLGADTFDALRIGYAESQTLLTPAQQAFAEHWAYHRNQTRAYLHAYPGSSANAAKTHARRLFADGRVQAEILRVAERWTDHSAIRLAELEHELSRIGRSDVRKLFDEHGNVRPPHEWDADTAAAVSSYQEEEKWEGRGEDRVKVITRKVRMAEKHGPLRTLMEAKGAFERNKAPPGIQASFTINLGAGPQALGGAGQSFTVDVGGGSAVPKAKKMPKVKALPVDIDATKTAPDGVFQPSHTEPIKPPAKRKAPKKPGKRALRAKRRALQAAGSQSAKVRTHSKAATPPPDTSKMAQDGVFQPIEEADHIYNGAIDRPIEPPAGAAGANDRPATRTKVRSLFGDLA
ncbi:MAG: terminase small subunit [Hyphomicrobiales bacterium]|nr:terminase small subunit [Hyphomicrobiales bacterium]